MYTLRNTKFSSVIKNLAGSLSQTQLNTLQHTSTRCNTHRILQHISHNVSDFALFWSTVVNFLLALSFGSGGGGGGHH